MNVYVIAERWGSAVGIGSLRPMKIAKYLLRKGHRVVVVCGAYAAESESDDDLDYLRAQKNYTELPIFDYSGIYKLEDNYRKKWVVKRIAKKDKEATAGHAPGQKTGAHKNVCKRAAINLYNNVYGMHKHRNSARVAYRKLKEFVFEPDFIFSSYEPLETHFLAWRLKRDFPKAKWNADFRDLLPYPWDKARLYRRKERLQKRLCDAADTATTVSENLYDIMKASGISNIHLLYSGFDPEDYRVTPEQPDDKLTLAYTGSLYPGMYNIEPLAAALADCIDAGTVDGRNVRMIYAGPHPQEFVAQTQVIANRMEIRNLGLVERARALSIQQSSDILILATVNKGGYTGLVTGKITEYWLAGKPIIAIIDGDTPNAEISRLMHESNTGFAYETCSLDEKQDKKRLREYIAMQYEAKRKGAVVYQADQAFLNARRYDFLTDRLLRIAEVGNADN